jgi:hypothetical protein
MKSFTPEDPLSASESRLARELLDSARLDDVSAAATRDAWSKFAGAASMLATQTGLPGAGEAAGVVTRARRGILAASAAALPWLALAGSIVTSAWRGSVPPPAPRVIVTSTPAIATVGPAAPIIAPTPAQQPPRPTTTSRAEPPPPHRVSIRLPSTTGSSSGTLAAEVAQLDAARTALEIGAFDEAKRLILEFHRRFPRGELRVEATVLKLEVLAAGGDRAATQSEGARFLADHGNDPHADRVRQLTDEARPR